MAGSLFACAALAAGALGLAAVYVFLVRPWHLRWGTTDDEAFGPLPGDDLVDRPKGQATHAVTIDAPPALVWPWLVQIGQDRGGFYSYTWLENLFGCRMWNIDHIVPAWQRLEEGDGVLFHPKYPRVQVAVVEPNQALVLGGLLDARTGTPAKGEVANPDACLATSWAFVLRDESEGRTRLIARLRSRWPRGLGSWRVNRLFWEPAHFVMERKMLRTVKRLAETSARTAGEDVEETVWERLARR